MLMLIIIITSCISDLFLYLSFTFDTFVVCANDETGDISECMREKLRQMQVIQSYFMLHYCMRHIEMQYAMHQVHARTCLNGQGAYFCHYRQYGQFLGNTVHANRYFNNTPVRKNTILSR